jgi:DNA-binding NtrC family response regulator
MMMHILITAADPGISQAVGQALPDKYRITCSETMQQALAKIKKSTPDLIFIELEMLLNSAGPKEADDRFTTFKSYCNEAKVVVLAEKERIRSAVNIVKAGAADYITLPIDAAEVQLVLQDLQERLIQSYELDHLRDQFWGPGVHETLRTRHAVMQHVYDQIRLVAGTKSTVLLTGDTGTGKTLLAKLIHNHSNRAEQVFMNIHCGAIPDTLIESELFGHEKGAFTGADRKKLGKFEVAKGGTLFMDEVGTLTHSAQIKLLQVLQDGTFTRVGGTDAQMTDVRVIAATNEDLKTAVDSGRFRKDLFYRLNVFPIAIPPLKDRPDDIPFLVDYFLEQQNAASDEKINSVQPRVIAALKKYGWPGNIRELENLIERAHILEQSSELTLESFPSELFEDQGPLAMVPVTIQMALGSARNQAVEDFERQYLKELLIANKGRINRSAEMAGITSRQLNKLMNKYRLRKEDFFD